MVPATPVVALREGGRPEHGPPRLHHRGPEQGKKSEHIAYASEGRYAKSHIIMVGDARVIGKHEAMACFFYPIAPVTKTPLAFHDEALDKFFAGECLGLRGEGDRRFGRASQTPPWK